MKDTIVLYPAPGLSHLVSMVEMGKLIIHHHSDQFSLTVLLTSGDTYDGSSAAVDSYINNVSQTTPSIVFQNLPALPNYQSPLKNPLGILFETIRRNNPNLRHTLQTISNTSYVAAFVIGTFCNPAFPVAAELNIPVYYYVPAGASSLSLYLHLPTIHTQTDKSFKDLGHTILDIPGLPPVRASQVPQNLHDRNNEVYGEVFLMFSTNFKKSRGIITNSFQALEPRAIEELSRQPQPIFCVGPLVAEAKKQSSEAYCLSWLDAQPSRSVVFLSFGSRGVFSAKQVAEIAAGLERSGQRFLWVVRNPPPVKGSGEKSASLSATGDFDLEAVLDEGFLERTRDRGLVVKSWAPQVDVLSRESVGGFVTHCGWNSVLEAVHAGVPMLAWPLYAEQAINKAVLVEDIKVAMPIDGVEEDGFVVAAEVEKRVRALMDSEEGRQMRERSRKLREKALAAWAHGGSSKTSLNKLAESCKQR